jgi:hypothetical protein
MARDGSSTLGTLLRYNPGVRPEKVVSAPVESDNGEGVILCGRHVFCNPVRGRFETRWHQARPLLARFFGLPHVREAAFRLAVT